MKFVERARTTLWNVPVGLQLSALYTLLLVATLALLGGALYVRLDDFLVQDTAKRLQQDIQPVLARAPDFERGRRGEARGPGPDTLGTSGTSGTSGAPAPEPFPQPFAQ